MSIKHHYTKSKSIMIISIAACSIAALALAFLLFVPQPFYTEGFKNLSEMTEYAKQTNENIPFVGTNTIKPDFTPYYNQFAPTLTNKLKGKLEWPGSKLHFTKPPLWSPSFFKTILEDVTKTREEKKWKDNYICKINTTPNTKFIVFGNIQGAYHSLIRDLNKLKELGFINDELKLTNPDYYIVFMGNIIDRSPFTMESLSIALRLLKVNQESVIYLRGNHESTNYWQEHTLKTELQYRATHLSNEVIPLEAAVNKFFNTLPLAVYITIPGANTNELIRISDKGLGKDELLNEKNYSKFLQAKAEHLSTYQIPDKPQESETAEEIAIKIIIEGEKKREKFQTMEGLRLLPPDQEATAWNVLSCPTVVYQKALNFFDDAFIVINAAQNLDDWKITLYCQDVREKSGYKAKTYYFLSGLDESGQQKEADMKENKEEAKKEQKAKPETKKETPAKKVAKEEKTTPVTKVTTQEVTVKAPTSEPAEPMPVTPAKPVEPTPTLQATPPPAPAATTPAQVTPAPAEPAQVTPVTMPKPVTTTPASAPLVMQPGQTVEITPQVTVTTGQAPQQPIPGQPHITVVIQPQVVAPTKTPSSQEIARTVIKETLKHVKEAIKNLEKGLEDKQNQNASGSENGAQKEAAPQAPLRIIK